MFTGKTTRRVGRVSPELSVGISEYKNSTTNTGNRREVKVIESKFVGKCYQFSCPHCDGEILVQWQDVNCKIFRHGVYSQKDKEGLPINPHETKENIEKLVDEKAIWGCGKPISMTKDNKEVFACNYI